MRKTTLALFSFLLASTKLFSQDNVKSFDMVLPKYIVGGSLYNTIRYLDSREGDTSIGSFYIGLLKNIPARLVFKTPFDIQLTGVVNALTNSTAKNGELLFQLERFNFIETYGTRFCYIDADLYAAANGKYEKIAALDTVILIRSIEVRTTVIESASTVITNFIAGNLLNQPAATNSYSILDIAHIDSIEMQNIPVFASENYVGGLYTSYASFAKQKPDMQGIIDADKDGTISTIKTIDSTGRKAKVHPKDLYAVVYKGVPFVAAPYGYYLLQKTANNSFLFTGDVKVPASTGDGGLGPFGPGISIPIGSTSSRETFIMTINHRNGSFIHLRKVEKAMQPG